MIELVIVQKLNALGIKNFPVDAPKDEAMPYVIWQLNGLKTHKDLSSTRHRSANIQFNVFAESYKQSKTIQYKLIEEFEDLEEEQEKYTLISSLTNAVDLFNTELKQTVVDIQIEYLIG